MCENLLTFHSTLKSMYEVRHLQWLSNRGQKHWVNSNCSTGMESWSIACKYIDHWAEPWMGDCLRKSKKPASLPLSCNTATVGNNYCPSSWARTRVTVIFPFRTAVHKTVIEMARDKTKNVGNSRGAESLVLLTRGDHSVNWEAWRRPTSGRGDCVDFLIHPGHTFTHRWPMLLPTRYKNIFNEGSLRLFLSLYVVFVAIALTNGRGEAKRAINCMPYLIRWSCHVRGESTPKWCFTSQLDF